MREYGYEYDAALNEKLWKETKGKVTDGMLLGAHCLRSGRDALKAIAREYAPCVALLPSLACDSMVQPFKQYGHKVKFYKLNADYSIDLDSLDIGEEQMLFLYLDYFGRSAISDEDLELLKSKGLFVFIEDRTHNLIWERQSLFCPDFGIASLRKWVQVPDGGLLWGNVRLPFGTDTAFAATRLKAQGMRHEYLKSGEELLKTEYRKIFSTVSDIMDVDEPSAMSAYSYELTKGMEWERIRRVRARNASILIDILSSSPHITFIQNRPGLSDLYVPFIVPNRNEVQRRLSLEGIFNTIIWPLADEQKDICRVAKYTEENMLAAPCDQRYSEEDMAFVGKEILKVITDVNR